MRGDAPPPAAPGSAAGGAFERVVGRLQELMPRRKPAYRRVTPLASRRETQRRAALAILALVVVVGGLGLGGLRVRRAGQAAGHQLGQRRAGGARQGARRTWPRSRARAST